MKFFVTLLALLLCFDAVAQVPDAARHYRRLLIRNSRLVWGLTAPVATFAGQIEQESAWNPLAKSYAGAGGLAQFMPATASWISGAYPALATNEPNNPVWAVRALVQYDQWLYDRVASKNGCDKMAKVLAAYNGGLGWIAKDEKAAVANKLDPDLWFGNVEKVNAGRTPSAWIENRSYPTRILFTLEVKYIKAGWGIGSCAAD